jgi:hypothetical protein
MSGSSMLSTRTPQTTPVILLALGLICGTPQSVAPSEYDAMFLPYLWLTFPYLHSVRYLSEIYKRFLHECRR